MPDRAFLDSNVLIYAYTGDDPRKQGIARELLNTSGWVVSTQVILETTRVLTRKAGVPLPDVDHSLRVVLDRTMSMTPELVRRAWHVSDRYGFAIFDSAIVAAALEARCKVLYSEDLQNGQRIERLTVRNPFI